MPESKSASPSKLFSADTKTAVVRYQIRNVDRALAFYTEHLGFKLVQRPAPIIAIIARGDLHLILSGPETSGARPLPDGTQQEPGGSNRIVLYVDDLDATIKSLRSAGAHFRNQIESGPGGRQIQLDDPDGNPIELHEPPK
jgi:glyoxylase I family protein